MSGTLDLIWHALRDALLMAWAVWWALVIGFAISAMVQAWAPRERVERALGSGGARPVSLATALGAVSSSCSYAAVAIARSLFAKGASAASALAFQFASTNLVWELGVVLWVLIGWQFTLAEFVGGLVMIALMTILLRVFVSPKAEEVARDHATGARGEHEHGSVSSHRLRWRERLLSAEGWSDVADNFSHDVLMLWKEITAGFLLAGVAAQFSNAFFTSLFVTNAPRPIPTLENVLVGPLIAVLSFVCSVGNVPLAAVLWSGGISFAGVLSFLFADLIVLPIIAIYRKFYGGGYAARIVGLMLVTMVVAALAVDGLFSLLGLIPSGPRPSRAAVFGSVQLDYKLILNVVGVLIFGTLMGLSARRAARAPAGAHVHHCH
ncbi:MAG TPA: permease [Solirubrobacteraceae bacterium]|nr:permease [Solirubrobacteraceae bacterium]